MWLQTYLPGREAPVGHGGCRGMEAPFWPLSESNTAGHSPAKAPGACTRPFWDVHPLEVKVPSSRSSRSSKSKHSTATAQGPLPGPQPAKTYPQKPCKPSKYVHPHPVKLFPCAFCPQVAEMMRDTDTHSPGGAGVLGTGTWLWASFPSLST